MDYGLQWIPRIWQRLCFFKIRNIQTIRTMRSSAYLVSPPHHQVGESCNPADGTQECDGEELLWRLKKKESEKLITRRGSWNAVLKDVSRTLCHIPFSWHLAALATRAGRQAWWRDRWSACGRIRARTGSEAGPPLPHLQPENRTKGFQTKVTYRA